MTLTAQQIHIIVDLLQLKTRRDGHYQTSWGHKDIEGLRKSIQNIINDIPSENNVQENVQEQD